MPKPDERAKEFFASVVPSDPRVKVRPMFGNNAAFVNGNMFMGLFGNDLFLRLSDDDRRELESKGGSNFEPMKGRPMTGYSVIPGSWKEDPKTVRAWVSRSLTWAGKLPPKVPKSAKK
ncbi:MAG: TfoX/Sxy family protein [Thaumarchaeota archaeon]|nr:TfoX/Sxy family protein [Nitrososphaerota archaeon]